MDKRIDRNALAAKMPRRWMSMPEIRDMLKVPNELYADLCAAVTELVACGRAEHGRVTQGLYEWSEFRRKS